MRSRFFAILIVIVAVEIVITGVLGFTIYRTKKGNANILGITNIVALKRDNFIGSPSAGLQYFYESAPGAYEEQPKDWLSQKIVYTINEDSLNERKNYAVIKPSETYRIIALGDSYTFGHYVNTMENWTERLEDMLNKNMRCNTIKSYEVINLGEPGYDVQYITHKYVTRGQKYHADLLVWFDSDASYSRLNELVMPIVQRYKETLTEEDIKTARDKGDYFPEYTRAYEELYSQYSPEEIRERIEAYWSEFLRVKGDTPFVFVLLNYNLGTEAIRWFKSLVQNQPDSFYYDNLPNLEDEKGIYPDSHPNPAGHGIIARDVYTYLTTSGLIPCN